MYQSSQLSNIINQFIASLKYKREPVALYQPIEYTMESGGKRIRPVLMLMAYNLYNENIDSVLYPAAAIEFYHNHTLLHDDVMDKADMRRNKPTVHKVWGENRAILSGDTMLVLAYQFVSHVPQDVLASIFDVFSSTAIEIAEGQQLDLEFESRMDVTEEEYIEMIRLKTSVLLASSLKIGAILGKADENDILNLYKFGESIGLAFQLQDDLLDVYGNPLVFGKSIGGDILCNKKTFLLINALRLSDSAQRERLDYFLQNTCQPNVDKINGVKALYDELHIKELCEQKIEYYFREAEDCLKRVSVPEQKKNELRAFINTLINRNT